MHSTGSSIRTGQQGDKNSSSGNGGNGFLMIFENIGS
jgi:hypothetical protein